MTSPTAMGAGGRYERRTMKNNTKLLPSQIQAIRLINEKPGMSTVTIGVDLANSLEAAGLIIIKRGKCYPTASAAVYGTRSASERRDDKMHAHATLMGRWAAMR